MSNVTMFLDGCWPPSTRSQSFEASRFSADLDFSTEQAIDADFLGRELNKACRFVQDTAGVIFDTESTRVEEKQLAQLKHDATRRIHEVRLYFEDFYGRRDHALISIRMDVTELDRILLPVQTRH